MSDPAAGADYAALASSLLGFLGAVLLALPQIATLQARRAGATTATMSSKRRKAAARSRAFFDERLRRWAERERACTLAGLGLLGLCFLVQAVAAVW